MGDGPRTIRIITADEVLLASARSAVKGLEGWELAQSNSPEELAKTAPAPGGVILVDAWLKSSSPYEALRKLAGQTRCRTFLVVEESNTLAEPIAHFCGASGILTRPLTTTKLKAALSGVIAPAALPKDQRREERGEVLLPERLLVDLCGPSSAPLIGAVTDPETSLFNFEFLSYKLDEEYKRAKRFGMPLACVMLGFEGQAAPAVLRELAGAFLQTSRDTDILGRFDESSFLFLLPNTGPDGAAVMARRIRDLAQEHGLTDLVGDALNIAVGISSYPHQAVNRREDLYARAREAFFLARAEGGGLVLAH